MPIYEYRCTKCNNLFEEWTKSFDSQASEPCPKCGGEARRIISQTSFKLEGSGWFASCYGKTAASDQKESKEPAATPTESPATPAAATAATPAAAPASEAK